jgi:hypothetical protein
LIKPALTAGFLLVWKRTQNPHFMLQ